MNWDTRSLDYSILALLLFLFVLLVLRVLLSEVLSMVIINHTQGHTPTEN